MGRGQRLGAAAQSQIEEAKEKFRKEAAHGPLHMRLDQPDSHGSGGNSDTGQMSRQFFCKEKRELFLLLVLGSEQEKDDLRKLHQMYCVILRIISSKSREIDTDSFEEFCRETYLHQV